MELEAQKLLNELLTETGHQLSLADFDQIQKINELTKQVIAPSVGDSDGLNGSVFYVGGIPIYPLTICRINLLVDLAKGCEEDIEQFVKFQAWVVSCADIEKREVELYEYEAARKEANKAWKRLPWTPAELEYVIGIRFGEADDDEGEPSQDSEYNPNSLIAMLVHDYGSTPHYWTYEAPVSMINSVMSDWYMRQEAQAAEFRQSGGSAAPVSSPKFKFARLRREALAKLRKAWTDGKEED